MATPPRTRRRPPSAPVPVCCRAVERRRRHAPAVSPLAAALQRRDQVTGGLCVGALAGAIATLLGDVLELTDDPVDLVIAHAPDQRGGEDTCDVDVVFGFH